MKITKNHFQNFFLEKKIIFKNTDKIDTVEEVKSALKDEVNKIENGNDEFNKSFENLPKEEGYGIFKEGLIQTLDELRGDPKFKDMTVQNFVDYLGLTVKYQEVAEKSKISDKKFNQLLDKKKWDEIFMPNFIKLYEDNKSIIIEAKKSLDRGSALQQIYPDRFSKKAIERLSKGTLTSLPDDFDHQKHSEQLQTTINMPPDEFFFLLVPVMPGLLERFNIPDELKNEIRRQKRNDDYLKISM